MVLDPRNTKTYRRLLRSQTITKGDPKVAATAQKLANLAMRVEVLPTLGQNRIRANSWNPLRADINGASAYGMKLWIQDKLALEVLKNDKLMALTEDIVIEAVMAAAMANGDFVQSILDTLRDEVYVDS